MARFAIVFISLIALVQPARAVVHTVDAGGGGDYLTIQEGINACSSGDTVLVAPGTYTDAGNRDLEFFGVNLVLMSDGGPDVTTIDCEGAGRGFRIHDDEDESSAIIGFTIRDASGAGSHGGGMYLAEVGTHVVNCIIENCTAAWGGGASIARYSGTTPDPTIENCVFRDNTAEDGGGLFNFGSSPTITGCVFDGNSSSTGAGGGIGCNSGSATPTITNCTIVNSGNAGINCYYMSPTITNTIVAFSHDAPSWGVGIKCSGSSNPTITHCFVFQNEDGDSLCGDYYDNRFEDPLFCDVMNGDSRLCANSPCIQANNPWGETVGALAEGCGDCDAPVESATWSTIKAVYR